MNLYLNCSYRAPSHATVLLWVKKYGLCQLSKKRQRADDWVVFLDESVQFFQNTKVDHVKNWTAENIGQTTLSKRFAVFNWNEKVKLN